LCVGGKAFDDPATRGHSVDDLVLRRKDTDDPTVGKAVDDPVYDLADRRTVCLNVVVMSQAVVFLGTGRYIRTYVLITT